MDATYMREGKKGGVKARDVQPRVGRSKREAQRFAKDRNGARDCTSLALLSVSLPQKVRSPTKS